MFRTGLIITASVALLVWADKTPRTNQGSVAGVNAPRYTADGKLMFPENYREWIFLTSGVDMNYNPALQKMDHSMFDNVFVNPEAYKSFLQTGTWPDKTMLVLEGRMAGSKASINKAGQFQAGEVMALEVHVKDEARFASGKWAFYGFEDKNPGSAFDKDMPCYSCHEQHGAVDTTFAQFYPTLIEIARKKGTLSAAYVKEEAAAKSSSEPAKRH